MRDLRHKNIDWQLHAGTNGLDWSLVQVAVLMDIRDALHSLDAKLDCYRVRDALDAVTKMHKTGVKIRRTRKRP